MLASPIDESITDANVVIGLSCATVTSVVNILSINAMAKSSRHTPSLDLPNLSSHTLASLAVSAS